MDKEIAMPMHKINSQGPPVTLKMESKSPKPKHLFGLFIRGIHVSLVKFHKLNQEIW